MKPSVNDIIPLEAECCLCPAMARQNRAFKGTKSKYCDDCSLLANTLGRTDLSNRKLKALRAKKCVRGLCTRYRCTKLPVLGKMYCSKCSDYQDNSWRRHRLKKLAQAKNLHNSPSSPSEVMESSQSVEYRRITIESLLCL